MPKPFVPSGIHMADQFVSRLTSPRSFFSESVLQNMGADAGFCPVSDRYALIVTQFAQWSPVFSQDMQDTEAAKHQFFILTNMLQELLNHKNIAITAEKDYQMVSVVSLRQEWEEFCSELHCTMETMLEALETEFNISVSIVVSPLANSMQQLSVAYQACQDVFGFCAYLEAESQLSFCEQMDDETKPIIHSVMTELDKKLITKLQAQDISGIKYVLHEIIDREFIQHRPTVKIFRIRLGGICSKILDVLDELKPLIGDELYYRLNPAPRIAEAATLSELSANMDDILDGISRHLDQNRDEPKPQWVDKMVQYIEENYQNEYLGLTEVSSVFGITPSYATRVFKQYTGRGIYETIQHVRLSAAKNLLYTDMTMKQIAQQVGYTSFLSMNRAFKKYEGTTPSRFKGKA